MVSYKTFAPVIAGAENTPHTTQNISNPCPFYPSSKSIQDCHLRAKAQVLQLTAHPHQLRASPGAHPQLLCLTPPCTPICPVQLLAHPAPPLAFALGLQLCIVSSTPQSISAFLPDSLNAKPSPPLLLHMSGCSFWLQKGLLPNPGVHGCNSFIRGG